MKTDKKKERQGIHRVGNRKGERYREGKERERERERERRKEIVREIVACKCNLSHFSSYVSPPQ